MDKTEAMKACPFCGYMMVDVCGNDLCASYRRPTVPEGLVEAIHNECMEHAEATVVLGEKSQGYQQAWLDAARILPERLATLSPSHDSRLADEPTDVEIKAVWKRHGGEQHGPMVEHYSIEERAFYRFARDLLALRTEGSRRE